MNLSSETEANILKASLELLHSISSESRLLQMKNLCINNGGTWTVPEDPETYKPCLFEAQLFNIHAMARDPEDLPHNWMIAAQRVVDGLSDHGTAA